VKVISMAELLAAIDCGTNSTRLLVSEDGARTVERLMRITRLGQGVDATGALSPDAVNRTLDVLREYRQVMDRHGVGRVRMTATSAARDAANREDFFTAAEEIVGARPELLTGEHEARLSFLGATAQLDAAEGPFLVVDIGGGSTEFAVGTTEPEAVLSVDIGCVRLTEKFILHDPPAPEELSQVISVTKDYLEDVARELPTALDAKRFVGLAGTVSTVAAIEQGLAEYDTEKIHHFVLTHAAAEDVFRTLAIEKRADRIHNPGLEEARAEVIVAGTAILVSIMRFFDFDECLVSEADILDGLVLSLLETT
jgi:exopolyphosphatase/guanosine-5'-triphosphate,3'-diphosphate pyrophosphatase